MVMIANHPYYYQHYLNAPLSLAVYSRIFSPPAAAAVAVAAGGGVAAAAAAARVVHLLDGPMDSIHGKYVFLCLLPLCGDDPCHHYGPCGFPLVVGQWMMV